MTATLHDLGVGRGRFVSRDMRAGFDSICKHTEVSVLNDKSLRNEVLPVARKAVKLGVR